ncbi:MAG: hypothetical protein Kow00128_23760 [Deltaproteobacteria bacterium]
MTTFSPAPFFRAMSGIRIFSTVSSNSPGRSPEDRPKKKAFRNRTRKAALARVRVPCDSVSVRCYLDPSGM